MQDKIEREAKGSKDDSSYDTLIFNLISCSNPPEHKMTIQLRPIITLNCVNVRGVNTDL